MGLNPKTILIERRTDFVIDFNRSHRLVKPELRSTPVEQQWFPAYRKGEDINDCGRYPVLKSGTLFGKIEFQHIVVVSGGWDAIIIGTDCEDSHFAFSLFAQQLRFVVDAGFGTSLWDIVDPVCVSNLLFVDCDLCLLTWLHFPYYYY